MHKMITVPECSEDPTHIRSTPEDPRSFAEHHQPSVTQESKDLLVIITPTATTMKPDACVLMRPQCGCYDEWEVFGFLGDGRLAVLSEAARVFWGGSYTGRVFRAFWYCNRFMHWAINLVHFWSWNRVEFMMEQSRQGQETMWCGLEGCPYPYVTMSQVGMTAYEHLDQSMARESRVAEIEIRCDIRPQWGVFLTDRQPIV